MTVGRQTLHRPLARSQNALVIRVLRGAVRTFDDLVLELAIDSSTELVHPVIPPWSPTVGAPPESKNERGPQNLRKVHPKLTIPDIPNDARSGPRKDVDPPRETPASSTDAYLVWDRLVSPTTNANPSAFVHEPAYRGPAMFSKTIDGGKTWSPAQIIYDPGQNNQTIDNESVAPAAGPAAGDLIDGFALILNKGAFGKPRSAYSIAVIRSTDGGATWSQPTTVSSLDVAEVSSLTGQPYRTGDLLPQFTSDPSNGNLYVVWQDGHFSSTGLAKVAFSESTDGGRTWSSPIEIDGASLAAAPTSRSSIAALTAPAPAAGAARLASRRAARST
jgi:hypothetical protein